MLRTMSKTKFKGVRCIWTCDYCSANIEELVMKPIDGIFVPEPFRHVGDELGEHVLCPECESIWQFEVWLANPNDVWIA